MGFGPGQLMFFFLFCFVCFFFVFCFALGGGGVRMEGPTF